MKALGILAVVAVVVVTAGFSIYGYANGLRTEALNREEALVAQYNANRAELSNMVSTVAEQASLGDAMSDNMKGILVAAAEGKFGDDGFKSGALLSAISEAYPDTDAVGEFYQKILPVASSLREGYRNKQQKIIDQARAYNVWRKDGFLQSRLIASAGYPSSDLAVQVGDSLLTGEAALTHLMNPVIDSTSRDAYESHELEPQTFTRPPSERQ